MQLYQKVVDFRYTLSNSALTSNVWLTFALIYERYQDLCRNAISKTSLCVNSSKSIHILSIIILFISIACNIPRYLEFNTYYLPEFKIYLLESSSLSTDFLYLLSYRIISNAIFISIIPYVLILFMFLRISYLVRQVYKASEYQISTQAKDSFYNSLDQDKILIVLSIRFFITKGIINFNDVLQIFMMLDEIFEPDVTLFVCYVGNFLVVILTSSLFCILFACSKKFKIGVKRWFK